MDVDPKVFARAVGRELARTGTAAGPPTPPPSPPAAEPEPEPPIDPNEVFAAIKVLFDRVEQRLDRIEAQPKPRDGADGRGLTSLRIDAAGDVHVSYSDGTNENLGRIVAAPKSLKVIRDADGKVTGSELE
jgi:hypothetical protein